MGTSYYAACHDCRQYIDLDKFYAFASALDLNAVADWQRVQEWLEEEREEEREEEPDGPTDLVRLQRARLEAFLKAHPTHRLEVGTEHNESLNDAIHGYSDDPALDEKNPYREVAPWPTPPGANAAPARALEPGEREAFAATVGTVPSTPVVIEEEAESAYDQLRASLAARIRDALQPFVGRMSTPELLTENHRRHGTRRRGMGRAVFVAIGTLAMSDTRDVTRAAKRVLREAAAGIDAESEIPIKLAERWHLPPGHRVVTLGYVGPTLVRCGWKAPGAATPELFVYDVARDEPSIELVVQTDGTVVVQPRKH